MSVEVDVLIIGCGPAGISAAQRLAGSGARVLAVEAGRGHTVRACPVDLMMACTGCRASCNTISGFGGCIHYGDGVKLSRFPSGRRLAELLGPVRAARLEVDALHALCGPELPEFGGATGASPFPVKDYPVASLTAAQVRDIVDRAEQRLAAAGVQVCLRTEVSGLVPATGEGWQAMLRGRRSHQLVRARSVVVAVGRRGRSWWHRQIRDLGLGFTPPTPSVGVRFEGPAALLRGGALVHQDYKTSLTRAGVKIKTFCYCAGRAGGGGRIKFTDYAAEGYTLLDGHVIAEPGPDEGQAVANFALLAQLREESGKPWDRDRVEAELITPYRRLRHERPGKPVLQWFPDFADRRLTCTSLEEFTRRSGVVPSVADYQMANLAAILPEPVHTGLVAAFTDLADYFTGTAAAQYAHRFGAIGLELENTWDEMALTPGMETTAHGLYAVGDCSGLAQGIVAAAVGGLAAAEHILQLDLVKGLAG
ncbi:FAD-dependent oxidoreductase [Nocardia farcinica]|uniref:FAD-dependent oxidoreductase n=1 Tax=Nocardia farcinica TaxID=37329 RepID=UPI001894AB1E|nr:FAD-dependent oxidoreductase [Nocardia farcinica]MBF6574105.1 FAD-dependent oxidoreductase [Nocardia farcinica]